MNQIFTRLFIIVCLLLSLNRVEAYRAPITSEVIFAFNLYTDYINVAIHDLWISHKHLEAFNLQLNQSYHQQAALSTGQLSALEFNASIGNQYHRRFEEILTHSNSIDAGSRVVLNEKLKSLHDLIAQIKLKTVQVEQFTEQKKYLSESGYENGYYLLEELAVLYEDFDIIKGELFFEVERAYKSYQLPDRHDPVVSAAEELNHLISLNRKILSGLRTEDRKSLKETYQELNKALGNAVFRQKVLLAKADGRPGSSYDPNLRYEEVVFQARALAIFTNEYLSQPNIDPRYKELGKGYYYFNFRHLNKFSREGQGLVSQYNRFISLSDEPILQAIGETNLFRPIPPKSINDQPKELVVENTRSREQNLVFLLDVSGSMNREEKLPVFKRAFAYLLQQLDTGDKVSIITYSGDARVVLPSTSAAETQAILSALQSVDVGGESKPVTGFKYAYEQAEENFIDQGNNRVIIISDGGFEIEHPLPKMVEEHGFRNISLDAFYFGKNDQVVRNRLLNLTELGKGNYTPIASEGAHLQLVEKILGKY